MEQYLIDTNIVSAYFSLSLPPEGMMFIDSVIDATPNLSIITQIELLCWNIDTEIELLINNFINDSIVLGIDDDVIQYCVTIRKKKKIKTPDAIIAATALAYGYSLVTNNIRDFANIKGLKLFNPYDDI